MVEGGRVVRLARLSRSIAKPPWGWERGEKPQAMGHQSRRRDSTMSSDDLEKGQSGKTKKKARN